MRELTIEKNDSGQRLDKFLAKAVRNMPKSLMYKSIRTKKIKINRKRTDPAYILTQGDTVQLFISEDFFEGKERKATNISVYEHTTPTFGIEYEDENLLIVYKPEGLSVHADEGNDRNNLITQILAYLYKKGEYDPVKEQSFTPSLCNRIDRNTEGLVIAAKNAEALREMNEIIKNRKITKKYLCIVHGTPYPKEAILNGWLKKDSETNKVRVSDKRFEGASEISTGYRVLKTSGMFSLLEVELFTGKTHQIRAHLAFIGNPLVGDGKYGINKEDRAIGYRSQALCSYYLKFNNTDGILGYMNGKEITVDKEKIGFLELIK